MKTNKLIFGSLAILVLSLPFSSVVESKPEFGRCNDFIPPVKFFSEPNGKGNAWTLNTCSPSSNMTGNCIRKNCLGNCVSTWNDKVSSVYDGGQTDITFWANSGYKGRCIIVRPRGKVINLSDFRFNDVASSFKVLRGAGCEDYTK